jgi:ADP-ribose pyrophosphatase YjhB (NUDIX family)
MTEPDLAGLRIREAVRALLIDPDDRVLLVKFIFPSATVWALPGGGLEPDESAHDGLRRELAEEVGLHGVQIGAHLWNRVHVIPFLDGSYDGQREQIFEVHTPAFEPAPQFTWEELRAEHVHEIRWWTRAELRTTDEQLVPTDLVHLLDDLSAHGPPPKPITIAA